MALLYASRELDKVVTANFDQKIGVQIIQNALKVLHSRFYYSILLLFGHYSLYILSYFKIVGEVQVLHLKHVAMYLLVLRTPMDTGVS